MDDLIGAITNATAEAMGDINTSMPGVVVSYDAATRRAVVQPSLSKQIADGRVLPAPQIVSVPIVFPTGGGFSMTWPLHPGDGVMLHFSQRSLEAWHDGGNAVPDDPRQFDLSDAMAVPGLNHGGATAAADPVNSVLSFGGASISISASGEMRLTATRIVTDSPIVSTAAITSKNITLATHKHTGVVRGVDNSLGPVQNT